MKLRSETRFRELIWLGRIVVYIIWLVQTSNTILYSSQLGKSWSIKSSNYVCGLYHFLGVFRRLREIWRAEMLSASQINYSRSICIRQCMRAVSENLFWLPILAPKFFACHSQCSVRTKMEKIVKNRWNWHLRPDFGSWIDWGVSWYILYGLFRQGILFL